MWLNETWHKAIRMPKAASLEQRIKWHLEHAEACGCRPVPARLLEQIAKRKQA